MSARRRGVVIGAVVLALVLVNAAVVMSAVGAADDGVLAAARASTLRAFFAAESGVHMVVTELGAGRDVPEGEIELPGGAVIEVSASAESPPMDVEIRGRYLDAVRVIRVSIE